MTFKHPLFFLPPCLPFLLASDLHASNLSSQTLHHEESLRSVTTDRNDAFVSRKAKPLSPHIQLPEFRDNGWRVELDWTTIGLGESRSPFTKWGKSNRRLVNSSDGVLKCFCPFTEGLWHLGWWQLQVGSWGGFADPTDLQNMGVTPRSCYFETGAGFRSFQMGMVEDAQWSIGILVAGLLPKSNWKQEKLYMWGSAVVDARFPTFRVEGSLNLGGAVSMAQWWSGTQPSEASAEVTLLAPPGLTSNCTLKDTTSAGASFLQLKGLLDLSYLFFDPRWAQFFRVWQAGFEYRSYLGNGQHAFIGRPVYSQDQWTQIQALSKESGAIENESVGMGHVLDYVVHVNFRHWFACELSVALIDQTRGNFGGFKFRFSPAYRTSWQGFRPSGSKALDRQCMTSRLGNRLYPIQRDPSHFRFLIGKSQKEKPLVVTSESVPTSTDPGNAG